MRMKKTTFFIRFFYIKPQQNEEEIALFPHGKYKEIQTDTKHNLYVIHT